MVAAVDTHPVRAQFSWICGLEATKLKFVPEVMRYASCERKHKFAQLIQS
jgi:hypothetical protein